jgi:serine/threonine-protein phosphatase PPG1
VHSIDQIKVVDRFKEIPHEGPMADLVWSDPDPDKEDFGISTRYECQMLLKDSYTNNFRGAGYTFGAEIVKKFLHVNDMVHILRAHQLCDQGFQVLFDDRLSTVWSAPNYCYRCGNMASVLEVSDSGERTFNVFDAAPENEEYREQQALQHNTMTEYFL